MKFVRGKDGKEDAVFTSLNSCINIFEPIQEQNEFDAKNPEYEQRQYFQQNNEKFEEYKWN